MKIDDLLPGIPNTQNSSDESSRVCPICGQAIDKIKLPYLGWVQPVCQCETKALAEEEAKKAELLRKERISKYFDMSELGKKHADSTFENYKVLPGNKAWFVAAKSYADKAEKHLEAGDGLMAMGKPGNGKTHLLAAIAKAVMGKGHTCIVRSVPALLERFKQSYEQDSRFNESDLHSALFDVELLGLDDLGAERANEWAQAKLYYLIDERYKARKSIIVTTNATMEELERRLDLRTLDRLCEMCDIVEVTAPSWRKEQAKARMRGAQ